jgi:hypothetical protein
VIEPAYGPSGDPGETLGPRAARRCRAIFGLTLRDWQTYWLDHTLAREADRWRYRTSVLSVARQGGKSVGLRALAADRLLAPGSMIGIISQDRRAACDILLGPIFAAFNRPEFAALRPKMRLQTGRERLSLEALDSHLVVLTTSAKAAHGYSLDLVLADEVWSIFDVAIASAITPTQVARPDPQLVVVSTAGTDQSVWFRSLVDAGRAGVPGLCYLEWSAPLDASADDESAWARANPSLDQGMTIEALRDARAKLPAGEFERAHMNRWTLTAERMIEAEAWRACWDPGVEPGPGVVFGFDVALDRSVGSIVASSVVGEVVVIELVDRRPGTDWILPRLAELRDRWHPNGLAGNVAGPCRALFDQARGVRLALEPYSTASYVSACQTLYDLIHSDPPRLRHRGEGALDIAAGTAVRRPLAGSWGFGRPDGGQDISALNAAAVACHMASRPQLVPKLAFG